jgi:hypothetical protein
VRVFFLEVILLIPALGFAEIPLKNEKELKITSDQVVIVTHASVEHDPRKTSLDGIEQLTEAAEKRKIPVIYLEEKGKEMNSFHPLSCKTAVRYQSGGGEFDYKKIKFTAKNVITSGGFFDRCAYHTLRHIVSAWEYNQVKGDLVIHTYAKGMYTSLDTLINMDLLPGKGPKIKECTTRGRNLEKIIGCLNSDDRKIYYKRVIQDVVQMMEKPPAEIGRKKILPHYSIALSIDGKETEVLRQGAKDAPVLRFNLQLEGIENRDVQQYVFGTSDDLQMTEVSKPAPH